MEMVNINTRPLVPRKRTPVPTEQEGGWVPSRSVHFGEQKYLLLLPGFEPRTIHPVAYTDNSIIYRIKSFSF